MRDRRHVLVAALAAAGAVHVADPPRADACGCLSPPSVPVGDYAINQSGEQIIFETEPGWVTAHVLIRYSGDPAKFAWLVPVPEVPELAISPVSAFALLDNATAPNITVDTEDICPISEWACSFHEPLHCGSFGGESGPASDAGAASLDALGGSPPVTVISQQVVGDYQTVTFQASQASAAVTWLRSNGFIVNPTTSIYMESYIQQNMVFVAAKLVPGAGISAIKPLRMRYRAAYPMVPLILTAVAADPNLTVTAFVYGSEAFKPMGRPVVTIDPKRIARDPTGRVNYPMVLARTIDEAGGDAFAIEYRGFAPYSNIGQSNCCTSGYDFCNVGDDGKCQCPNAAFDQNDCKKVGDLVDGVALVNSLEAKYSWLTRITTRISAEEMTFDPTFEPDFYGKQSGAISLRNSQASLAACASAVIDQTAFAQMQAMQACAAVYCGPGGQCVTTAAGPACACGDGQVAERFSDFDGDSSVTCVPAKPPVDLRAGGDVLPDACKGISCGSGTCIDRNGVPVCACNPGSAAIATATAPRCEPIAGDSHTPGAQDFSGALRGLAVCAPPPPTCGPNGWLTKVGSRRPGIDCGGTQPEARLTIPGPAPTCGGWAGCSGCQARDGSGAAVVAGAWLALVLLLRRSRRR